MKSRKKTVYYDGECPMCQAFQAKVGASNQAEKFTFVDVNTQTLPSDISKEQALQQMHVVDANGIVYKNADSVLAVLDEYKSLRWLARIGRLPIINSFLRVGYRWVARNRYSLFGATAQLWWLKLVVICGLLLGITIVLLYGMRSGLF
jgi:predicted DCC family thiol-disulfide oxidoreductase YuxK